MSAARVRRRLMRHERARRRGLLLGAPTVPWYPATAAHCRRFEQAHRAMRGRWGWPWVLNPPRGETPP